MIVVNKHITLKPLSVNDHKSLWELMNTIYVPAYGDYWEDHGDFYLNEQYSKHNFSQELNNTNAYYFFIVYNSETCGILRLIKNTTFSANNSKRALKLHRLYLSKNTQGKGIGKTLLNWVFNFAKHEKQDLVWLEVMTSQPQALNFYNSSGFVLADSYKLHYKQMFEHKQNIQSMYKNVL